MSEVPKKQIREKAKPIKYYLSRYKSDKKVGMAQAYATGQYSMSEIARVFNVHYSTVSRVVAKCKTCPYDLYK